MSLAPLSSRAPADLEKAIRPFVQTAPKPDRARVYFNGGQNTTGETSDTEGNDIPTLSWTATASVQVTTLPSLGFSVFEGDYTESERQTHVQRITDASNPDNFVDVEVIDKIAFKDKTGKPSTYNYNNS